MTSLSLSLCADLFSGNVNQKNFHLYCKYRNEFSRIVATVPLVKCNQSAQHWSPSNVSLLIKHRSQTNPTCFKTIASHLNELEDRSPSVMRGRFYTARDCQNKWSKLFPSAEDMYSALKYLRKLKQMWPGCHVKVEDSKGTLADVAVIKALHIVFPWTLSTMQYLSKTVFCDATFHVTIYEYKVVCLTTLDGNHQHRPLMMSFITESTTSQWKTIFDVFYMYVLFVLDTILM